MGLNGWWRVCGGNGGCYGAGVGAGASASAVVVDDGGSEGLGDDSFECYPDFFFKIEAGLGEACMGVKRVCCDILAFEAHFKGAEARSRTVELTSLAIT